MDRITQKQLEVLVNEINTLTNSPLEYSDKTVTGFKSNINHYCLDMAYGGAKLVRIVNEGGGQREISNIGYGTKRELYHFMRAFIMGLEYKK